MRKKIIGVMLSNCLTACSLLGCGGMEGYTKDYATASENLWELGTGCDLAEDSDIQAGENQEEAAADEPAENRTVDLTDYSSYLNKIWCINGEDTE